MPRKPRLTLQASVHFDHWPAWLRRHPVVVALGAVVVLGLAAIATLARAGLFH